MGGECSAYGGEEGRIQGFYGETWSKTAGAWMLTSQGQRNAESKNSLKYALQCYEFIPLWRGVSSRRKLKMHSRLIC